MYSISIITAMVVAQDTCTGLSIADCTSSSRFGCSWLPSSGECVRLCFDLNEAECTSNPACEYYSGYCIDVAPCSERMLESCIANCGIVAGQNTCRSCSSAANKTDCGRISNCEWDGQKCGASSLECFTFSQSECTETGCSWRGHCNVPSVFYDGLCKTSNTTNCIRYKNDLVPCSELTTRPLCAWQATCEWNSFSQSCVDADFCLAIGDEGKDLCESVGCTDADDMFCTNATAFTKCASISDKDNCNNQKTCAFYEIYNTSTCSPALGCNSLPESVCTEKPDCRWNSSSNTCGDSGRPCGEIRMLCGGEKCKNMVRDPDMTEYSYFGSFFDGQLAISTSSQAQLLKDGIPCVDCPGCQPGYVPNVGATIQCGADGIGSVGQQICVLPGDYSDGTGTPDKPDDDDGGNNTIVIVVAAVCSLLVVVILVLLAVKVCNKKNSQKESASYTHELN
eukprot:TRINITY_DN249_c0_g1_i2.p1 TRINITY_DN249_c0_g1~~TRINITY_DN249_c0_g1_i2.p1  ORF type:complete len:452 (+),score=67.66 TRINITY_DN249_c0_g1_i2:77-1432(+)